jgi:hypothetical protein
VIATLSAGSRLSPELVLVLPEEDRLAAVESLPMPERWKPAAYVVAGSVARTRVQLTAVLRYAAERLLATMIFNAGIALGIAILVVLAALR